jgi:hypothetical protein
VRLRRATLDPKTLRRNIRYSEVTYGVSPTAADIIDLTGGTTPPVAGRQAVSSRSNRPAAPGWFPRPSGRRGAWSGNSPVLTGPGVVLRVRCLWHLPPLCFAVGGRPPTPPACGFAAKPPAPYTPFPPHSTFPPHLTSTTPRTRFPPRSSGHPLGCVLVRYRPTELAIRARPKVMRDTSGPSGGTLYPTSWADGLRGHRRAETRDDAA